MKYFIVLSALLVLGSAQRPSYASSGPIGRPGLASRFKDTTSSTSSSGSTTVSFENRVGEESSSTPKIPVDARGDTDLVNTLNSWEREHQPFWFINAEHIEKARNTTRATIPPTTSTVGTQVNNRNRFETENVSQGNQGGRVPENHNGFVHDSRDDVASQSSFATNQAGSFHPHSDSNRRPLVYPNTFEAGHFGGNPRRPSKFHHNKFSFYKF